MPARKTNTVGLSLRRVIRVSLAAVLLGEGQGCRALSTAAGVVRVDLEKELVQRQTASFEEDEAVLLSNSEAANDYAQLRNLQNLHISRSFAAVGGEESNAMAADQSSVAATVHDDQEVEISSSTGEEIQAMEPPLSLENVQTSVSVTAGAKTA